jgi:hypothetical protein
MKTQEITKSQNLTSNEVKSVGGIRTSKTDRECLQRQERHLKIEDYYLQQQLFYSTLKK